MYTQETKNIITDGGAVWCYIVGNKHQSVTPITVVRALKGDKGIFIEYVDLLSMEMYVEPIRFVTFLFSWEKLLLPVLTRRRIVHRLKSEKVSKREVVWTLGEPTPSWGPDRIIPVYEKDMPEEKRYSMMRSIASVGGMIEPLPDIVCKIYEVNNKAGRDLVRAVVDKIAEASVALRTWHSVYENYYLPHVRQQEVWR
jgi:hypothetical protein